MESTTNEQQKTSARLDEILQQEFHSLSRGVDKVFLFLLIFQWFSSVWVAYFITPTTWLGSYGASEYFASLAFIFGGVFVIPPSVGFWLEPGRKVTRYLFTLGQMLFSVLFIYLTGGRIESHFHIFISLAFIAFYKEYGLLWLAGFIALMDHILRGYFFPMSIYSEIMNAIWRWREHGFWIVIENLSLSLGIYKSRLATLDLARSRFALIQAKEEAIRATNNKYAFLSKVSHEVRSPLGTIIGFSEVLAETELNDEQRQYTNIIKRCSESLSVLINDFLDLSKIDNGLMAINRHEFNARKLHGEIFEMFALQCAEKGVKLQFQIDPDVPEVLMGDSHRIRQILINLIDNARKFTEKGVIILNMMPEPGVEGVYRWNIQDTGVGIDPENIKNLFKIFSQGSANVTQKYGGSGLGLLISKNLIELMGGTIEVHSQKGEGTLFTFTLKLEKESLRQITSKETPQIEELLQA